MSEEKDQQPVLYYVYDALCGWCYGFSPVIGKLVAEHPELDVEVVSGGMIRGERRGQLKDVAAYIRSAYKDVEHATGVKFGSGFIDGPLQSGDMYMTSEPPAALLSHLKQVLPTRQVEAAKVLQNGIYHEGLGPSTPEYARYVAAKLNVAPQPCIDALTDSAFAKTAAQDFALSARMGVRGFPAVLLSKDNTLTLLASGFVRYEILLGALESAQQTA